MKYIITFGIISGLILLVLVFLALPVMMEPDLSPVHICDWQACCTGTVSQHYDTCDYEGCKDLNPNWTAPNCSVTP